MRDDVKGFGGPTPKDEATAKRNVRGVGGPPPRSGKQKSDSIAPERLNPFLVHLSNHPEQADMRTYLDVVQGEVDALAKVQTARLLKAKPELGWTKDLAEQAGPLFVAQAAASLLREREPDLFRSMVVSYYHLDPSLADLQDLAAEAVSENLAAERARYRRSSLLLGLSMQVGIGGFILVLYLLLIAPLLSGSAGLP